ncbi:tol-pal system protein YbgF [Candidatus Thiothrix anitrata]|jgi:tol-pal system protein YbgF|uniref:Cell division coordinator CpoB n=1 Tax=Candidatus Thiothrix anitrata TaxID=2823902 RepID=A0ABX7X6I5_9GAMM|nr:tol-pal system protein YbgF [Candidatus Thiothrix anitrata]QTR51241.1 tol-pal system protein YbgF [Candidatus Thiothrix anitrata]
MRDKENRHSLAMLLGLLLSAPAVAAPLSDEAAVQLLDRLSQMEREVSNLRGENEQLRNDLQGLQKSQTEALLQVDEKIDKLAPETTPSTISDASAGSDTIGKSTVLPDPNAGKSATTDPNSYYSYGTGKTDDKNLSKPDAANTSATDSKPEATKSDDTKLVAAPSDNALPPPMREERAVYDDAFNTLLKSPKDAVPAFRNFLKDYPNSTLTSSAQYWVGEALYAEKDFKGAADEFLLVLKEHKGSDKAPGAALKLGFSFYELKEWDKARKTLEDVVSFFPKETETVQKAQERLDRMKSEGR